MSNFRQQLHLIWADKVALAVAALAVVATGLMWVFVMLAAGAKGANHVLASVGVDGAIEGAAYLAGFWALLRALDFAFGGATAKMFTRPSEHPAAASLPVGGNLLAH